MSIGQAVTHEKCAAGRLRYESQPVSKSGATRPR
jgi:hypothetical protein